MYSALAQGVVDGAENNPPSFVANKHSEVCKHFSLDGHTRIPDLLLISEELWQGLSGQQRGWIRQAAKDCTQYQRKLWAEASSKALSDAKAQGVQIIEADVAAFQAACAPLLAGYQDGSIGALLERIAEMGP